MKVNFGRTQSSGPIWLMLVMVGATRFLDVDVLGRVAVSELLMIAAIPFLVADAKKAKFPSTLLIFLGLMILAMASVAISDFIVNRVGFESFKRGIARYGFLTIITVFWWLALRGRFHVLSGYFLGMVFGAIINFFVVSEFDREAVQLGLTGYDFRLTKVSPLVMAMVMLACFYLFKKSTLAVVALLVATSAFIAMTAGRAQAGEYLLGAIGVGLIWWHGVRGRTLVFKPTQVAKFIGILLIGGFLVYGSYSLAAPRGWLGAYQQLKFERQAAGRMGATPWGILLGGRVDFVQAAMVVRDAPIWGVGSWSIPRHYLSEAYAEVGLPMPRHVRQAAASGGSSAGHSILMGSWATGGILTVPLFIFGIWTVARLLLWSLAKPSPLSPFLIVMAFSFFFAVMFSPFSLSSRNTMGMLIGAACAVGAGLPKLLGPRNRSAKKNRMVSTVFPRDSAW